MSGRAPGRRGTVAAVHDNFVGPTGMGAVAERLAHIALDDGWELTVIGSHISPALRARCEFRRVPSFPRLPALPQHLGWCALAARALRGVRCDVVHVHSPFLMPLADVMTAHFMAAPAHARGVRDIRPGLAGALRRAQDSATRRLDDRLYRRHAAGVRMSFVSEFLRDEFLRAYGAGAQRRTWVLPPVAPPWRPVGASERAAAKRRWRCSGEVVVGFLGGIDPRKGLADARALALEPDLYPLFAGYGTEALEVPRGRGLGFVDANDMLEACDVLVAPSRFDSAPMAVLQALARGVPVVVSATNGWAPAVVRHRAGVVWDDACDLAAAVRAAASVAPVACRDMVMAMDGAQQRATLRELYGASGSAIATNGRRHA